MGSGGFGNFPFNPGAGGQPDVDNGECDQVNFQSTRKPVDVLLVLDRSASMTEHDIAPGVTRWEGVVPIVNEAVTATDATVSWGLKTFPERQGNQCEPSSVTDLIDVEIAANNAAAVVEQVNVTTPEGDGTPTAAALEAAVAYLSERDTDHQQFILLATDGQPSCSLAWRQDGSDARADAIAAAGDAYAAGIPVFVVGVLDPDPSGSTVETLNGIAVAGGKPRADADTKFHLASSQEELNAALAEITGEVATCVFPFENAPPEPGNIAVKVNGQTLERDASRREGWEYTSDAHLGVELFGEVCTQLKAGDQNNIDIIFGCPGRPIE